MSTGFEDNPSVLCWRIWLRSSWQAVGSGFGAVLLGPLTLFMLVAGVFVVRMPGGLPARLFTLAVMGCMAALTAYVSRDMRGGNRRDLRRSWPQGPAGRRCQKERLGRRRRLAGAPGRGTLAKDAAHPRPDPTWGEVVLSMLANVQQRTIKPIITAAVAPGTHVHTDEYSICARLPA